MRVPSFGEIGLKPKNQPYDYNKVLRFMCYYILDCFVEDLWNIHDPGARYQESQAENSRQVKEFIF